MLARGALGARTLCHVEAGHARETGHDLPFVPDRAGHAIRGPYIMKQLGRDVAEYRGRTASFEMRHPFRGRRLVEFTIGAPESQFLHNGVRRAGMTAAVEQVAASPIAIRLLDVERMRRFLAAWPADAAAVASERHYRALYMGAIVNAFEAFDGRG